MIYSFKKRLFSNHPVYCRLPKFFCYRKQTFTFSILFEIISLFKCWRFVSAWNQSGASHWKWIPTFVTVFSVPNNHEYRDHTYCLVPFSSFNDAVSNAGLHSKEQFFIVAIPLCVNTISIYTIFTSYTTINIIIHKIKCYKFNGH